MVVADGAALGSEIALLVQYKNKYDGYENSSAQKYAEKYNRKFEVIKNESGDMNADGVLNIADVIQTQKWLTGVYDDCTFDIKAADMNENGTVDIADLCMIKERLVGNQ